MNRGSDVFPRGFRRLSVDARRQLVARRFGLGLADLERFDHGLDAATADRMIENAIGVCSVPLGLALHFVLDGRAVLVPMAIEEPSVVAAASFAAKLVAAGGGFETSSSETVMIAQVEVRDVHDTTAAARALEAELPALGRLVDAAVPSLVARGGGFRGGAVRILAREESQGAHHGLLVADLFLDVRDAMGANLCNTVAEALASRIAAVAQGTAGLRIVSNLADHRLTTARARVPFDALDTGALRGFDVARGIAQACRFAELDPYRAATHNKGIMNGIDAVALATGQDWRAIEAGAHAYAAVRAGPPSRYAPLSRWWVDEGAAHLRGEMTLPLQVGTVGGALRVHRGARLALDLMEVPDARALASVMAAAGLATNLAALRAMTTEGIQKGHMPLHARSKE